MLGEIKYTHLIRRHPTFGIKLSLVQQHGVEIEDVNHLHGRMGTHGRMGRHGRM